MPSLFFFVKKMIPKPIKKIIIPLYRFLLLPKVEHCHGDIFIKRESYIGRRCFIIGSGPSINEMDLGLLDNDITFVVNRGYLLKENNLNKPTFYGISDRYAFESYGANIDPLQYKHCFIVGDIDWNKERDNCSFFDLYTRNTIFKKMRHGFFQFDISQPLSHSSTVVLHMLQIAVWLGFKDIYFIGVDNNFNLANMHFYKDLNSEVINMSRFDDPCKSNELSFKNAYLILKKRGINLYNAGVGGALESLPRVDFISLFDKDVKSNHNL